MKKTTPSKIVTAAELARELGCAKSRITQLKSAGLSTRSDGKLDRTDALTWIASYTSGMGGGWIGALRGKESLQDRAEALLAGKPMPKAARRETATPNVADAERAGLVRALADISSAEEQLKFARMALRFGCTPDQAYMLAAWYSVQASLALPDVDASDVSNSDPTESQWCSVLGPLEFATLDNEYDRLTAATLDPLGEPVPPAPSPREKESLAEAQARKERALATLREIEAARAAGEAVAIADVEQAMGAMISVARSRLLALPAALAPVLAVEKTAGACEKILREGVTDALAELAAGKYLDQK